MPPTSRKPSFWQTFQPLDPITKGVTLGLAIVSIGSLLWLATDLWGRTRIHRLVLAAGSPTGESYILAKAIEKVVEAQVPSVEIDVQESKGTSENLERLEQRQADLVTAQADVPAGNRARTVAVLYPDSFQLVVQGKSPVQKFTDLKGKRIGLPNQGGQYDSFILVAQHFGLTPQDFIFVGENDQAVDTAFAQGQVDAVFRVRAIGNASLATMIKSQGGRLIAIDQADAMRVHYPAFEPTQLPKGAYKGSEPAVPAAELATVAVQRLLLAHDRVDPDILRRITQVLNENRRELQAAIPANLGNTAPLVANIRRPELTGGTGIPLHPGALAYYDRDKPSFIQENADYLALILTVGLLSGSWLWELKRWFDRRRKDIADNYIEQAIVLMNAPIAPQAALKELDQLFEQVAAELVREGISQESFRTFNEAYKTVREVIVRKAKNNLANQAVPIAPVK
jgi:uncharacterized protein